MGCRIKGDQGEMKGTVFMKLVLNCKMKSSWCLEIVSMPSSCFHAGQESRQDLRGFQVGKMDQQLLGDDGKLC